MNTPVHLIGRVVRVLDSERQPTNLIGLAYRLQHTEQGRRIVVRHEHGDEVYEPEQLGLDETH